jgi:hypothetical protein
MDALPDIWLPLEALPWRDYRDSVWKAREQCNGSLVIDELLDLLEEGGASSQTGRMSDLTAGSP